MQVKTKSGIRPLSEVARAVVAPGDIASTGWPAVRDTCRSKLGIDFDAWQDGAGRLILAKRADGKLAATVGGVGMSLPRQVGKTYLLAGLIFGLCVNTPGLLVIWSAHHARTHAETFLSMQAFADRPKVKPYVDRVFLGSGDEEIRFHNGSRILFGARERGFGRGIPGVDALIMDEAQILSERALQNMLATLNTSQLGLHVYVGTPPKPDDNCEMFTRMRNEALSRQATDLVWIECGADENASLDDRKQWAKANASYPHRTPEESIERLRRKLDPDGFRREGLGIWPSGVSTVFDLVAWVSLEDRDAPPPRRVALVVHVAEYRKAAAIAVAGDLADGSTLLLAMAGDGDGWVSEKIIELVAARDIAEVALAPGEARGLGGDLARAGVEYRKLTGVDVAASCTAFQSAIGKSAKALDAKQKPLLRHAGQRELDTAVAKGKTKRVGPSETWEDGTESALIAAAAAYHRWTLQEAPMPAIY